MTWVDAAKAVEAEVAALRILARKATVEDSRTRRVPCVHTETFHILRGAYEMTEQTWQNGAEDVFIQRMKVALKMYAPGGAVWSTWQPYAAAFDFQWNTRIGRTSAFYASPANDTVCLSRTGLGTMDRNQELAFSRPYRLPAGEALTTRVKPVYFLPAAGGVSMFHLDLSYVGWRTGVHA